MKNHIENEKLKTENQKLRDEINLLKGEQGKPDFPSSKKKQKGDISAENERKKQEPPKQKKSKAKNVVERRLRPTYKASLLVVKTFERYNRNRRAYKRLSVGYPEDFVAFL